MRKPHQTVSRHCTLTRLALGVWFMCVKYKRLEGRFRAPDRSSPHARHGTSLKFWSHAGMTAWATVLASVTDSAAVPAGEGARLPSIHHDGHHDDREAVVSSRTCCSTRGLDPSMRSCSPTSTRTTPMQRSTGRRTTCDRCESICAEALRQGPPIHGTIGRCGTQGACCARGCLELSVLTRSLEPKTADSSQWL